MHPDLSQQLARSRQDELLREADRARSSGRARRGPLVRRLLLVTVLGLAAGGAAKAHAAVVQQAALTASDGAAGDAFGARVALSGNTVVVASRPPFSGAAGRTYVLERPASAWGDASQSATLALPADAGSPTSVAISDDTIVVGAMDAKVAASDKQGAVYVFVKPAGGWQGAQPVATLTASDGAGADGLGFAVAMNGDTIVSSAPLHKVGAKDKQGAAYVFVKPGGGWANAHEAAELTASDGAANDLLRPVAIDGGTIVAGAQNRKVDQVTNQGEAYVFVKPPAGWATSTETARLATASGARDDFLGAVVGISGDTVIAGTPDRTPTGRPSHAGSVEVFAKPASGWATETETAELTASDGAINDDFGSAAAISGDTIVAGGDEHTIGQNGSQGEAYVFTRRPGPGWSSATEDQRLLEAQGGTLDQFGSSIVMSGNVALIGAPFRKVADKAMAGAAYAFGVPPSISLLAPMDGSQFARGQAVAASYSCAPPRGTGTTTCLGPVAPGAPIDTSALGPHTFTVSAVDGDGITATQSITYTVVRPKAPSIAALKQSVARWRERGKRPVGTTFSFRVDKAAGVTLRFTRRGKPAGSLRRNGHAGLNRIRFIGRLSRAKKLAPGRYALRITATNATGQSSTSRRLSFRIIA